MKAPATLIAAALLALGSAARAEEPADKRREAAEKLFVEGREASARGENELACAKFRSSVTLFPVASAVANVARCAEREGRAVEALRAWEQVIAMLPAGDERIGPARERAAAIGARVPRLTLALPADLPADARILVDGAPLSREAWGAPLPLAPGEHTVLVEALERRDQRFTVILGDGDRKELPVRAGPPPASASPPPPPPPPPPPVTDGRRVAGFVVGGAGAAGLVIAGITGGVLLSRDARIHALCPDRVCTPEGTQEIAGSKPLLIANAAAWGAGLAGVGAGAALLIVSRGRAAPAITAAPLVSHRGAGVSLGGTF
jgi:hypothetical protein